MRLYFDLNRTISTIPTHLEPIQNTITQIVTTVQQPPLISRPDFQPPLDNIFFLFSRVYFFSTFKDSVVNDIPLSTTVFQNARTVVDKVITYTKVQETPPTTNPSRCKLYFVSNSRQILLLLL